MVVSELVSALLEACAWHAGAGEPMGTVAAMIPSAAADLSWTSAEGEDSALTSSVTEPGAAAMNAALLAGWLAMRFC